MRHILKAFLIVLAIAVTAQAGQPMLTQGAGASKPTSDGSVRVGDKAPLFNLNDLSGEPLSLTRCLGDKPTVLVFWSYFCFPCQAEMPVLQEFYDEMGEENITLIAISLDTTDFAKFIDPFVAKHNLTFPILYDNETELFYETAERYGVVGTPTTFLLDCDGTIRFIHLGRLNKQVLKGIVESAKSKSYCADIIKPKINVTASPEGEKKIKTGSKPAN